MKCSHLDLVKTDRPRSRGCEECLKLGDTWVHLRLCRTCGHVGCCDDSKNKHATKHFAAVGHPLVRSIEPGERWIWCYVDEVEFESLPAPKA
jgi:uncharacterized UBP type Zn finger protein